MNAIFNSWHDVPKEPFVDGMPYGLYLTSDKFIPSNQVCGLKQIIFDVVCSYNCKRSNTLGLYRYNVQGVPGNNVQATVYRLYTCTDIRLERCAGVRKQWIICNNGDHIRLIKYISLQKNIKS